MGGYFRVGNKEERRLPEGQDPLLREALLQRKKKGGQAPERGEHGVTGRSPERNFLRKRGNFRASWPNHDVGAETAGRGFSSTLEATAHIVVVTSVVAYKDLLESGEVRNDLRDRGRDTGESGTPSFRRN